MKKINSAEFRRMYLDFYKKNNHAEIEGAPIVPIDDPTVLFTTAGMQPLVPNFMGKPHPAGRRLTDIQRCIRTTDIEEVGDNSHLTCFEMLGCWSLGDYWKNDIAKFSWEFLTSDEYLGIPKEKLFFTVFEGDSEVERDNEAFDAWVNAGADPSHIVFLPRENNFWMLSTGVGPCGPDSEMFYDTGIEPCGPNCKPGCDCKKYIEIGNNVFLQYERSADGVYKPLAQRNIDQGMGFERGLMLINNVNSAYETDLFDGLKEKLEELTGKKYADNLKSFRVVMEHMRTVVFILGDNSHVTPSNTERGYVLRRLIRRVIRHLKMLDAIGSEAIVTLANVIINEYGCYYPELIDNQEFIRNSLIKEERVFSSTINQGIKEFNKVISGLTNSIIPGVVAFRLFDTFGFPLELTEELAAENGLTVDKQGYEACYKEHQEKSRKGVEGHFKGGLVTQSVETARLHTATHLLNAGLRKVLGDEVFQRGSNITAERLRFDFSFGRKVTSEELAEVENFVNEVIALGIDVVMEEMTYTEAKEKGAIGVFTDKYNFDKLKVYSIGSYSMEICGGPHASNTKELGRFKILKEESASAGVRRIKAVLETL